MEHNALRSWHATMYKFVTSMVLCGLGMQQGAATIQKRDHRRPKLIVCILYGTSGASDL